MGSRPSVSDRDPRPRPETLLRDPSVSDPLKLVLRTWSRRDPVDAARDAGLLAITLERLADERCGRWKPWEGEDGP